MATCRACGERNPDRARFCMICAASLDAGPPVGESRKVVTIVFADVTGSTAIGERLDPEAARRILTTFYASARETLEWHGGTVEKFIGDAVMAVFGVPRVREDDAPRAVRAAWRLLEVMANLNAELGQRYGAELQLRVGVNTGEVVAGDPASQSSFVAGDAVNVAARLEQVAVPGTVHLGAETYELARAIAEVEPAEPLALKGKSEPVPAFRLVGIRASEEPAVIQEVPLAGRDAELESLDRALERVIHTGTARTVALLGPAGIGKTRLIRELARRSVGRARAIGCRCFPEGERAAIAPVRDLLASALGLSGDAPIDRLEREARALVGAGNRAELILATLRQLIEERDTTEVSWVLGEILAAASRRDPVVVTIDDLHLATPAVRSVLARSHQRVTEAPLLWVETWRTEAEGSKTLPQGIDPTFLKPLGREDSRELLASASLDLPKNAISGILAAAEGNPLFLLETARLVAEHPERAMELPSSIRALLAARIEDLADAGRRALEVAATIGRIAPVSWVEELLDPAEARAIDELVAEGFVSVTFDTISFSHGSLRDVVYASATKQRRAELHEQIAELAERDQTPVEILAHHLERAVTLRAELGAPDEHDRRLSARAATALGMAGLQSLAAGDRIAAAAVLPRASALVASVGEDGGSRTVVGKLAFQLGAWDAVVAMLEPIAASPSALNPLGVALVKRGLPGDLERGRDLLSRAISAGDVDAGAALAGSWKGFDEDRALELYRSALELDPTDPYTLGNVMEYEIQETGDLSPVADRRPALASALLRRRGQALAGEDRPWSFFDLGKFELFLGEDNECLSSFAAAIATSSASFMIDTTIRSLERVGVAFDGMSGYGWARELLDLGRRSRFEEPLDEGPTAVWILVGGSDIETDSRIATYRDALISAFAELEGTLISGGTAQGVSALAADVSSAIETVRSVGYLPSELPNEVHEDFRYDELRRIASGGFGPSEPLSYWRDLLQGGVRATDVRVIAIGGGRLTALETQIALAVGAQVAVIAGSGGSSNALMSDPTWGTSPRLAGIEPSWERIRAFLLPNSD